MGDVPEEETPRLPNGGPDPPKDGHAQERILHKQPDGAAPVVIDIPPEYADFADLRVAEAAADAKVSRKRKPSPGGGCQNKLPLLLGIVAAVFLCIGLCGIGYFGDF